MTISRKRLIYAVVAIVAAWFVWHAVTAVDIVNSKPTGTNIIAFGDSLTYGTGAGRGEDYPSQLSQMAGIQVLNEGVAGETTHQALRRLDRDVLEQDPKIVIVFLGGNDLLQQLPRQETFANLEAIVRRIQRSGALVVLVGLKGFLLSDSYGPEYKKVARETGCVFVPNALGGILTSAKLKSDQVHPNGAGYKIIAERVYKAIRPYLR